jgi:hypothetical protein
VFNGLPAVYLGVTMVMGRLYTLFGL